MEKESNPMQALCRSGCGFYGSLATDGLCSLCYKEALKKKQQPPVSAPSPSTVNTNAARATTTSSSNFMETTTGQPTVQILPAQNNTPPTTATTSISIAAEPQHQTSDNAAAAAIADDANPGSSVEQPENDNSDKDDKDVKKKKNRCAVCRKKVGLTGFECRCGGLFCAAHRYSDKHDCSFNYREMGAQEIRRNNPVVVGEKIQKI